MGKSMIIFRHLRNVLNDLNSFNPQIPQIRRSRNGSERRATGQDPDEA